VATWQDSNWQRLTPIQRLRQLEPSWLRSGQTTSLLASVIEKDEVRDDLGGILHVYKTQTPPSDGTVGARWSRGADGGLAIGSFSILSDTGWDRGEVQLTCKWPAMPKLSHLTFVGGELGKGAIGGCGHGERAPSSFGRCNRRCFEG